MHDLLSEGYDFEHLGDVEHPREELAELVRQGVVNAAETEVARVVRVDRGLPLVVSASGTYRAESSNALVKRMKKNALVRPAVGDWVALSHPDGHDSARIEEILPRTSAFMRKDPGENAIEQIILANIDIVFVVTALGSDPVNLARLERKLVLAYESGAHPVIVLTKSDRCEACDTELARVRTIAGEVPVVATSTVTGEGIDELRAFIQPKITAAMIGSSGVGKSTLINALVGTEAQATGAVREGDDKGRHVTVAREIVVVPGGGILIDTPGMRAVALWHADRGLTLAYPEITEAAERCKFADCTHESEPNCGVKAALDTGEIDAERYARYTKLRDELAEVAEQREAKRRAKNERRPNERETRAKQVAKARRDIKKYRSR